MNSSRIFMLTLFITFSNVINAQEWQEHANGLLPVNYGTYSVSIVDENVVWAVAWDKTIPSPVPGDHIIKVIKTTDGGASWNLIDVEAAIGRISFDIQAIDEHTAWITTQDYNSGVGRGLFKTEDGGVTWDLKLLDYTAGIWLRFFDDNYGICINSGRYRRTFDGGENWTDLDTIPEFLIGQEFNILSSGTNTCEVHGDTIWFGTNMGRVFRSVDKGASWENFSIGLGTGATIRTFSFRNSQHGLLLTQINGQDYWILFETMDGGETWEPLTDIFPLQNPLNIENVPGRDGTWFLAGFFGAAYTEDFGISWTLADSTNAFGAMEFTSPQVGWACNWFVVEDTSPAIFKWTGEFPVASKATPIQSQVEIYPNPVSEQLTIAHINDKVDYVLVTNINGAILRRIKVRNQKELTLDLSDLAAGIYFIQLTGEAIFTKKVIKID